jgi:hypothetical protein
MQIYTKLTGLPWYTIFSFVCALLVQLRHFKNTVLVFQL